MLKQVVVTEITLDDGMCARTYIGSHGSQLAPKLALCDVPCPVGQYEIGAVAEHFLLPDAVTQVDVNGTYSVALIRQFDFA